MARPSAVSTSIYRKEIEEFIKEGRTNTFISNWLKEKDAYISTKTIGNYRNIDFNIQVEAQRKYNEKKSKKRLDEATDEVVSDLEKIDLITSLIEPEIVDELDERSQLIIFDKLLNTKYKILGQINDGANVNVNIDESTNNEVNLFTRVEELKSYLEKGNNGDD